MKEYTPIRDIAYEYNADDGLSYSSPARGVWNIVHIGTLVPGGHQIYVCPTSCLRGVVLTTAELGAMDRLSTITVGEDNILEGDMEETLHEGVCKVIDSLPVRPRMMMVFTSCIHHFLAVNYQRIYRLLRKEYPDIDFIDCYMHPIMRRTSPPVPTLWRQMYRVLKPADPAAPEQSSADSADPVAADQAADPGSCGKQISILACEFPRDAYCDAVQHLKQHGVHIADVTGSRTYDEFLTMSRSSLNLLFHKAGMKAAKDLEIRLKQPYLMMRPGYVYEEIDTDMKTLSERIGIPAPSEEETAYLRSMAEQAAADAAAVLGDTPVSVDGTAVDCPLGLCIYLLEHGFRVETLFVDNFTESEDVFNRLRSLKPDLKVYSALNWNMRRKERGWQPDEKIVAIGQRAAYFHDTNYFVDLVNNDGMYGYRGIVRLMELLTEACREKKDMRRLIQIKGWGCSCG
ncbi:MAG: nitrogenase [Stomatobaculum sp.]|nr:nitrogenase [Stomatobaculum sp.]